MIAFIKEFQPRCDWQVRKALMLFKDIRCKLLNSRIGVSQQSQQLMHFNLQRCITMIPLQDLDRPDSRQRAVGSRDDLEQVFR